MKDNPFINHKKKIAEQMEDSNFWNVRDDLKGLPAEEIIAAQRKATLPFSVCILNLHGDLNTGMIARTACIYGASEIIIFGRRKYDKRSTVGAQNYVPITRVDGFVSGTQTLCVEKFRSMTADKNLRPFFVEQGGDDIGTYDAMDWLEIANEDDRLPVLVFGNESDGVPEDFLAEGTILTIPQFGVLRSLNVSAAAAIAIHQVATDIRDGLIMRSHYMKYFDDK